MRTKWLSGMKLRKFHKYWKRMRIDGVGYSFDSYTKLFQLHSQVMIGDYIFNPYKSIWETVKEIKIETTYLSDYTGSNRHRNVKFYKYKFITETNFVVYDLNEYKDYFSQDSETPLPPNQLGKCWY